MAVLLGTRTEFSAGARLFHAVSLSACLLLLLMIPFNVSLGFYNIGWLLLGLLLAHAGLYFLSRVKKKFTLAVAGITFLFYAGASLNYYLNSGINGPSLFIFFFTFSLLIAVTRRKYHGIYLVLAFLVTGGLLYADYHHPGWIKYSFQTKFDRYIDLYVVFIFALLFIYLVTRSLIDSYYYEKKRAARKAMDLGLQNKELERVTAEKEKLFSVIFHDLKSPLNSIRMYLEMVNDISIDKEQEDTIKKELLRRTRETLGILDHMLLWARDQAGKMQPNLQPVCIRDAVNSSLLVEEPFAQSKHVKTVVSIKQEMTVSADITMLQLLLRILINNAIKFTPRDARIFIDIYEQGDRCLVKVKDSGTGIAPENREKIFTLGVEGARGTNNEKGAGLGLALAYQFAARQQIDIWFSSKPGQGAEFFLSLPLKTGTEY